jgi:hypothetical protein
MRSSPSASKAASSTSSDDRTAFFGQAGQVDRLDPRRLKQAVAHLRQCLGGHRALGELHRRADLADRLGGARGAERLVPAQRAIRGRELLELGAHLCDGGFPALAPQLAVGEEPARGGDRADLHALAFDRLEAAADDEFRRSAADVDDQPEVARLGRLLVRHPEVDQACFLAAGHHFDRVPERALRGHEEALRQCKAAHGIGRDRPDARRGNVAEALAEAREAFQGAVAHLRIEAALRVQALGQAHRLLDPVDDAQLAQHVARHHHVEAVGAQVDGGEEVAVPQRQPRSVQEPVHPQILPSRRSCAACGVSPAGGCRRR